MAGKSKIAESVEVPEGKVLIKVHNQDGPGGTDDVFVAVNGRPFLIKRECEVVIPEEILGALRDAVETKFHQDSKTLEIVERNVPRFNITHLR